MKKTVILLLSCLLLFFYGCDIKSADADNTTERTTDAASEPASSTDNSEEKAIINMFIQYGTYSDGVYRFYKNSVQGNVVFGYNFSYNPSNGRFVCSTLVTTYISSSSYVMSDYGSVGFQWGDLENGYYSGDHILEDETSAKVISKIAFEFPTATTYKVTTNTYSQLSKADIDEYADICFECLEQGLAYANTIISSYTDNITLG